MFSINLYSDGVKAQYAVGDGELSPTGDAETANGSGVVEGDAQNGFIQSLVSVPEQGYACTGVFRGVYQALQSIFNAVLMAMIALWVYLYATSETLTLCVFLHCY